MSKNIYSFVCGLRRLNVHMWWSIYTYMFLIFVLLGEGYTFVCLLTTSTIIMDYNYIMFYFNIKPVVRRERDSHN